MSLFKRTIQKEVDASVQNEMNRYKADQRAKDEEFRELMRQREMEYRERVRIQEQISREQIRQAKEQERLAEVQRKQAAVLARHEEQIMKLEQRLTLAEGEIAFNREQRERLFTLLDIEENELAAAVPYGKEWQKRQRKIIALQNQIHTVQRKIDKAQMDRHFCENRMEALS